MSERFELISLSDLIEQVKADLLTNSNGDNPVFFIEGIEIAAQVVARRDRAEGGKAGVGIDLSVLGFKADAGIDTKTALTSQQTQTVTIKLSPLLTRDEYLAQLDPAAQDKVKQTVAEIVTRGPAGGSAASV